MPLLPIGTGVTADVDQTGTRENAPALLVNCYVDRSGGYRRVPPSRDFSILGGGEVWVYEGKLTGIVLYFMGGAVYRAFADGGIAEIPGAVITPGVPVSCIEDANYIYFAARSIIHKTDGTTISDLGPDSPRDVTHLSFFGPFMVANGAPGVGAEVPGDLHYNDNIDGSGYMTGWEVFNNEYKPDALNALVVLNNYLFCVGSTTTEVNYLTQEVTNPIGRYEAGIRDYGTPAPYSVASDGESLYMLSYIGGKLEVLRLKGGTEAEPIGVPLALPLDRLEEVADAVGTIVSFRGQNFYVLTLPSANVTINGVFFPSLAFSYHIQGGAWTIMAKWDNGEWQRPLLNCFHYVEAWRKRVYGTIDGRVLEFYEDEEADYVTEPTYVHRWRDDGKETWTNGRVIDIGPTGDYYRIKTTRGCGLYRTRQHEIEYSDHSEAGDTFRILIRSGHVGGNSVVRERRVAAYHHQVKRGTNDFILLSIEEEQAR